MISSLALALFAFLSPLARAALVRVELMDARECRYVLERYEDLGCDLLLLARRARDLDDAPPAADALRFPPRAVCCDAIQFNRAYADHLEAVRFVELIHAQAIDEARQENERCWQVWDAVRDARCEYYYVSVRRYAMKRLRDELLGPEAYSAGRLPPPVPLWRFRSAD